jgi:hypothetical protein
MTPFGNLQSPKHPLTQQLVKSSAKIIFNSACQVFSKSQAPAALLLFLGAGLCGGFSLPVLVVSK